MKPLTKYLLAFTILLLPLLGRAASILIPMDEIQKDHLKSYGIAFWVLKNGETVDWLLNYRGGSFMAKYSKKLEDECNIRGVSYEVLADAKVAQITAEINDPSVNMDIVKLEKAPRMAVYSPADKGPLEDAVVLVLHYAEIPFDRVYDEEVLKGDLSKYDWLHLHHEDFTAQHGKFYAAYHTFPWYQEEERVQSETAARLGFSKVTQEKAAVALGIKDWVGKGGFMFGMCSATDTYDIALAAAGLDIADVVYDGDPPDFSAQSKLDY